MGWANHHKSSVSFDVRELWRRASPVARAANARTCYPAAGMEEADRGHPATALRLAVGTSIVSLITMPPWLAVQAFSGAGGCSS
jgi:hypothetical protein